MLHTFYLWLIVHFSPRSFKALLKLPSLVKILNKWSSSHIITPLLDVIVPQLVSSGLKNASIEEQEDHVTQPLLDIALEFLKDTEIDKDSVIVISRSESIIVHLVNP